MVWVIQIHLFTLIIKFSLFSYALNPNRLRACVYIAYNTSIYSCYCRTLRKDKRSWENLTLKLYYLISFLKVALKKLNFRGIVLKWENYYIQTYPVKRDHLSPNECLIVLYAIGDDDMGLLGRTNNIFFSPQHNLT